jgi:hypothetical protein
MTRKLLAGAEVVSNWTGIAGALHGTLRYLGRDVDQPYVMGVSGHAFRLAIAHSPSGIPSPISHLCFDYQRATALYAGLGFTWDWIGARPEDPDYPRIRERALQQIRRSIDKGRPAAVYGLHLAEFGIVNGYDDRANILFVSSSLSPQYGGTLPLAQWPAPGQPAWIAAILPVKPRTVLDADAGRAAVSFAVAYARAGDPGGPPEAAHGLAAYDRWIECYGGPERLDPFGNARCIQVLQAARRDAASYLRAIAPRYSNAARPLLEQAAGEYDAEALALSRLSTLFPYPSGGDPTARGMLMAAAASLRQAAANELTAVERLEDALPRM